MISFKQQGNFSKFTNFLEKAKEIISVGELNKFGQIGVSALASQTPVDTGETAASWYYTVENTKGQIKINFNNSNIQNGIPIAIILQYGRGTKNGGWVDGKDYINPAIQPVFDDIVDKAWKGLKNK